jgi:thiamine biosynthesis lipoprotein
MGVLAGPEGPSEPHAAVDQAFQVVAKAQSLWSFQDPASELSRLNGQPGQWVSVCRATWHLLRLCKALMVRSHGTFDCTVGGALVLRGALPDHGGGAPLPGGDVDDIELRPGQARLKRPVRLSLDGIAKGMAVDLAVAALRRGGCPGGWVNAGGDLRAFGRMSLPLHRRGLDGRPTPLGVLQHGAVATSRVGAAEPAFPSVIVGAGSDARPAVYTVMAGTAWRADALTKVAANLPQAQRAAGVARLRGRWVDGAA